MKEQSDEATVSCTKGCMFDSSLLPIKENILIFNFTLMTAASDNAITNWAAALL